MSAKQAINSVIESASIVPVSDVIRDYKSANGDSGHWFYKAIRHCVWRQSPALSELREFDPFL